MFPMRFNNTKAEEGMAMEMEEPTTQSAENDPARLESSISASKPLSEQDYEITLYNTFKNIVLFRHPCCSPSPDALSDFQNEMERRLKPKGDCAIGTSSYKIISIHPSSIPEDISFDKMMCGATYPPLKRNSFTSFLKHIDYNYENFRFWILHELYTELFNAVSEEHSTALSPEWTKEDDEIAKKATNRAIITKRTSIVPRTAPECPPTPPASSGSQCTLDSLKHNRRGQRYSTPPGTADGPRIALIGRSMSESEIDVIAPFVKHDALAIPVGSYSIYSSPAGPDLPIAVQNLWKQVDRIIADYIDPDGAHTLNLSFKEREMLIYAMQRSNHPSAMKIAFDCADHVLRNDSYPKFLQLATPNTNRPRQKFAYCMGYLCILYGVILATVLSLSHKPRSWRLFAIVFITTGVATLYAARHGMCLVLHSLGHYQVKPWDMYENEEAEDREQAVPEIFLGGAYKPESKDWVQKYNRRWRFRKIFDKEKPIQEPRIRNAQTVIFGQGVFLGLLASVIVLGFFMALPPANNF